LLLGFGFSFCLVSCGAGVWDRVSKGKEEKVGGVAVTAGFGNSKSGKLSNFGGGADVATSGAANVGISVVLALDYEADAGR